MRLKQKYCSSLRLAYATLQTADHKRLNSKIVSEEVEVGDTGTEEMAQKLKPLAVPPEGPGLVPSTYMMVHNHLLLIPGDPMPSSYHKAHKRCTDIYASKVLIYIKYNSKIRLKRNKIKNSFLTLHFNSNSLQFQIYHATT